MKTINFITNRVFFLSILLVISFSVNSLSQIQQLVNLTADKYEIQQWEKVNIKASLNFNGINTSYRFLINNKQVTVGVNNNEIKNYEFKNTGTFTVKVIARSNPNQEINIPPLTDSITVKVTKVKLFVNPPKEIFTGETVTFKLGYKLPENYVKYRFHFGDNSQSEWLNESIATHVYEHNGNYRAYVEISKFDGATLYDVIQSEIKRLQVKLEPSYEISLSAITNTTVDDNITFTATPITNVSNPNFRFLFDFGDNSPIATLSQNKVKHSFSNPGTYYSSVKLLSNNDQVLATSEPLKINVKDIIIPKERISFSVDPMNVQANEKVSFKLEHQIKNKNLRYRFYYGVGLEPSPWLNQSQSTYEYEKPGNYEVYAEVGRFEGNTIYSLVNSDTKQVKVNPYFKVNLLANTSMNVDEVINFRAEVSTNAINQDFRFLFDFGDGTPSSAQPQNEIQHSYRTVRTYDSRVNLLTRDGKLLATSDLLRVEVKDILISPESISLYVDPTEVNADEEVKFKLELQNENQNLRYKFYYGEGLPPSDWIEIRESRYRYKRPDIYEVYAEVGRFDGDSVYSLVRSNKMRVKVNPFIEVSLSANTSAKVNEDITFKAEVTTNIENTDFRYLFDFGDSNHSEPQLENTATHSFNKKGTYTVTANLLNAQGKILGSEILQINVEESNSLLIYILIALAGLIGGSFTIKYLITPKIKLTSHCDIGEQTITKEKDTLIEMTIQIIPNTNEAKFHLDTSNKKLLDKIRRKK
jgi:PKD repeat protein